MQGHQGWGSPRLRKRILLDPILVRGRYRLDTARYDLIEAWAGFLEKFAWQGFWTLTFEDDYSARSARKAFLRWAYRFTVSEPNALSFIGFIEYGRRTPRVPHIHALTRLEKSDRRVMWADWYQRYGRAQSRRYDPSRGATFYLAKYCTKEVVDVILEERSSEQLWLLTPIEST